MEKSIGMNLCVIPMLFLSRKLRLCPNMQKAALFGEGLEEAGGKSAVAGLGEMDAVMGQGNIPAAGIGKRNSQPGMPALRGKIVRAN